MKFYLNKVVLMFSRDFAISSWADITISSEPEPFSLTSVGDYLEDSYWEINGLLDADTTSLFIGDLLGVRLSPAHNTIIVGEMITTKVWLTLDNVVTELDFLVQALFSVYKDSIVRFIDETKHAGIIDLQKKGFVEFKNKFITTFVDKKIRFCPSLFSVNESVGVEVELQDEICDRVRHWLYDNDVWQ